MERRGIEHSQKVVARSGPRSRPRAVLIGCPGTELGAALPGNGLIVASKGGFDGMEDPLLRV